MNEILDRHIFTNKKIKSYIENRNKYLKKVKTKDYKHCESDFNKILKNCQSLFDERIKHVKTSFEKYGKKSRKNIFKVKIKEGAWKSITYNDLPTLNKKCFDDYFIDCPSMYVLVKVLVKSRYKHLYKHLDDLSTGDKNAAIMVLIMNQEGFGPLIMDEPEKYLDVNSITGILVPRMRKLKTQQQIICVTNNEYILLSGDAEQVITTKSENKIDVITGDINNSEIQEQILEIFEGDKFELKKKSRKLSNIIE